MTAVAEGAALSPSQSTGPRRAVDARAAAASSAPVESSTSPSTTLPATPGTRAKIVAQVRGQVTPGAEFQIDSLDTGWTSGRLPLTNGAVVEVTLSKNGENTFRVFVFDSNGGPFVSNRTGSPSLGPPPLLKRFPRRIRSAWRWMIWGVAAIDWLVRAGDQLPKRARNATRRPNPSRPEAAGRSSSSCWEGESDDPADNRSIGEFKITGADFERGTIRLAPSFNANLKCSTPATSLWKFRCQKCRRVFQAATTTPRRARSISPARRIAFRRRVTAPSARAMRSRKCSTIRFRQARRKLELAVTLETDERY